MSGSIQIPLYLCRSMYMQIDNEGKNHSEDHNRQALCLRRLFKPGVDLALVTAISPKEIAHRYPYFCNVIGNFGYGQALFSIRKHESNKRVKRLCCRGKRKSSRRMAEWSSWLGRVIRCSNHCQARSRRAASRRVAWRRE